MKKEIDALKNEKFLFYTSGLAALYLEEPQREGSFNNFNT